MNLDSHDGAARPHHRSWKEHLWKKLRRLCPGVATSRLADPRPRDVEAPLRPALKLADRAEASCAEIDGMSGIPGPSDSIRGFIGHVRPRADLTGRRTLKGGTIPHRGKVHPISGPHTRWISKGKAVFPVEPGVPVRVLEDRHRFLPHRSVMWEGSAVDVAVPMGGEARARFPDLSVVSFDRGPHSPPDLTKSHTCTSSHSRLRFPRASRTWMARFSLAGPCRTFFGPRRWPPLVRMRADGAP